MILFVDTNILLHYSNLDQVDWKEVCGNNNVQILFSPVVIEELDKHKRNPNQKVSKRAKNVIKKISDTGLTGNWGSSVTIEIITKRPTNETYLKYSLDKEEQDDRLLATILEFSASRSNDVKLLTNDLGPRLKCISLGIETLSLPETYALKEDDELSKEITRLKEQLNKYQTRIPRLALHFENNKEFHSILLTPFDFEKIKVEKLSKAIQKNPHIEISKDLSSIMKFQFLGTKSIEAYNSELNKYYSDYEEYLIESKEFFLTASLTSSIKFKLSNSGSVPANDIDIKLHFPDGFSLKDRKPKNKMNKPTVPFKPGEIFTRLPILPTLYSTPSVNPIPGITTSFQIKKTNSYDVSLTLKTLKHNQDFISDEILVVFDSLESAASFQIEYEIYAANIPDIIEGKLNVIIEKQ